MQFASEIMGCVISSSAEDPITKSINPSKPVVSYQSNVVASSSQKRQYKFLCLHGFRTSGKILEYQTSSLRYHTNIHGTFIDGPIEATGEPSDGVEMIYPPSEFKYYEWTNAEDSSDIEKLSKQLENSVAIVIAELQKGQYDGLLGFSQGASLVTATLEWLQRYDIMSLIKCAILIGGVPPDRYVKKNIKPTIRIPSLHIIGDTDRLKPESMELLTWYDEKHQTTLTHPEDHRIPTMATGIYPKVLSWLKETLDK